MKSQIQGNRVKREKTRVKEIVQGIEAKTKFPDVPGLNIGSKDLGHLRSFSTETSSACLTARVARMLEKSQHDITIAVGSPSTRQDFIFYAQKHGLEEFVANSDAPINTLVDYKSSYRIADLFIQVETGHVVFAFNRKTLGCVHISDILSMECVEPCAEEGCQPMQRRSAANSTGVAELISPGFQRKFPCRIAFTTTGKSRPLIVGFECASVRRNALRKLSVLRLFFEETAREARRS